MDRRRGLLQDNAIFYFDFSTSHGSYLELIESLKLPENPVRSLDIRCIDFNQLPVDPLLDIIRTRPQLQRVMLTYPENWPAHAAASFCECVTANPSIETVWLSDVQNFSTALRTMLRGLVQVNKLLVSMDQLRGNPTVRLETCRMLREYVLSGHHLTLCDVRFHHHSFRPIAEALKSSAQPPTIEFRWCSFDAAATKLLQGAYTQGRNKRLSIGFESIRNPFPPSESKVFQTLLGSRSSIAKLKLDTFLKGTTDFLATLQAIVECPSLTHLCLWNLDSHKYAAVTEALPRMYQLRQFSFSVSDIVPMSGMLQAVEANLSLELVKGDFVPLDQQKIGALCRRNEQCKRWVRRGGAGVPPALFPTVVACLNGCAQGQSWVAATLLHLGEGVGPTQQQRLG